MKNVTQCLSDEEHLTKKTGVAPISCPHMGVLELHQHERPNLRQRPASNVLVSSHVMDSKLLYYLRWKFVITEDIYVLSVYCPPCIMILEGKEIERIRRRVKVAP
ncbi:hypothetical protein ACFX16_009760 [Malus domestica]